MTRDLSLPRTGARAGCVDSGAATISPATRSAAALCVPERTGADGIGGGGGAGNNLPDEPRVSLALPDVRSLAQYPGRHGGAWNDSRPDRIRSGASAGCAANQAL